jgi:hypothetical protein
VTISLSATSSTPNSMSAPDRTELTRIAKIVTAGTKPFQPDASAVVRRGTTIGPLPASVIAKQQADHARFLQIQQLAFPPSPFASPERQTMLKLATSGLNGYFARMQAAPSTIETKA